VHAAGVTQSADRTATEQVAELDLADAVLAWRARTSVGFRRFSQSSIIRDRSTL